MLTLKYAFSTVAAWCFLCGSHGLMMSSTISFHSGGYTYNLASLFPYDYKGDVVTVFLVLLSLEISEDWLMCYLILFYQLKSEPEVCNLHKFSPAS